MRKLRVGVVGLVMAGMATAQVTERVSVGPGGAQGIAGGDLPQYSAACVDGRFVAFMSGSFNLVPGDTNATWDVFARDRESDTTELVSVTTGGIQGNGFSGLYGVSIVAGGRFVAFESRATNLVTGDTNFTSDVFLRDRLNGTTERVSASTGGVQGNKRSEYPSITPDGRYVAFDSEASNLVPGDTNGFYDIFVRDRLNGTTERVSVDSSGTEPNDNCLSPWITSDGRYVAFVSQASNLVPGDTNGYYDIFVSDRQLGTIERVSLSSAGAEANAHCGSPSISADGRSIAFTSDADNLVAVGSNMTIQAFLHDRVNGTTELVSVSDAGTPGNSQTIYVALSADGRYVVFKSASTNLAPGDTNSDTDIFVRDRLTGTTERVSVTSAGGQAVGDSDLPSISADGRYVTFRSYSPDLVSGDTNGWGDVFIRDREATGFTIVCEPGAAGVISCPCSNAPSGPGRGCDNSGGTGGAVLSASGVAYLSMDILSFTTSDELSEATSMLLQGNAEIPNGAVFGQGVRCAGGMLLRLYVKTAAGGSITAPDLGAGDPSVSTQSAALGDPIQPGHSRFYQVFYRDPLVLGGCPSSSTFNATHAGRVTWSL